jgi:hypothetical protein
MALESLKASVLKVQKIRCGCLVAPNRRIGFRQVRGILDLHLRNQPSFTDISQQAASSGRAEL